MKKIISLTSFPARINYVKHTIISLINQNITADKIVLYLGADKFPNKEKDIPQDLLQLIGKKFEIHWVDRDLRSFTKLLPALKEYPDDIIITADDDIIYPNNWLQLLYQSYLQNPEFIHCHRAHQITFRKGKINSYNNWNKTIASGISYNNFLTGVGGVLYPPKTLHKDVFNEQSFKTLCPYADDIWFWAMALLNNVKIKVVENNISTLKYIAGSQEIEDCLFKQNVANNRNDTQLQAVLDKYGNYIYNKLSHIPANNFVIRKYFLGIQIFKLIETQTSTKIFLFGVCFFNFLKHNN